MNKDNFTPNPIGPLLETLDKKIDILIEDMRGEFRAVTEVVLPLREDMAEVKTRLSSVEFEVRTLKDVFRVEFPAMRRRIEAVEKIH